MHKLALAAVVSLLFALGPGSALAAAAGEGASSHSVRHVAKKTHAKRAEQGVAADNRDRMVRRVELVHGKRKVSWQRVRHVAPSIMARSAGDLAGLGHTPDPLELRSNVAFVLDQASSEVLFEKNANVALPIASITKLMTGLVVVEAQQDMDEVLAITEADVDRIKHSSSRLRVGARMTRRDLLHIALMSSENRAASALGRNYPGGLPAFVAAMNAKAQALGMNDTHYVDSNGLSSQNVSSARDLARLVSVAHDHAMLRQYTTDPNYVVQASGRAMRFNNTNYLVSLPGWNIGLQKTGFINEAGRCLVMQALIQGRNVIMVFLDSKGKMSRTADAGRMRRWLETFKLPGISTGPAAPTLSAAVSSGVAAPSLPETTVPPPVQSSLSAVGVPTVQ
jgi:serine-type D-Ala-D-Ala endopeptidase (penicillin-binding protein 7)